MLVGRPVLWGLSVNGQSGVTQVLNLLNEELALTMKLAGCARLGDISSDLLYSDHIFRTACLNGERATRTTAPEMNARCGSRGEGDDFRSSIASRPWARLSVGDTLGRLPK